MRFFILVGLLCASIALAASAKASEKPIRTLPAYDGVLHTKGKSASIPGFVELDERMKLNERILQWVEEKNDDKFWKDDADIETAVHKRKLHRRKGPNNYRRKARRKVKKKVQKAKKKIKKRRRRRRRRRRTKKPKLPSTWPPTKLPPKIPTLPPAVRCPCAIVARRAKECYAFTNEAEGICKLGMCGHKWQCVANSKSLCLRKFATEVIELLPGKYDRCQRRQHRPKPFWVYYGKVKATGTDQGAPY